MAVEPPVALTYSSYLALDEVLGAQRPRSDQHDELLFIVVHQVHELWFKELLHELTRLQRELVAGESAHALRTLHRCQAVLRIVVAGIDTVETMTPFQFTAFRSRLGSASGFQSPQFREIEAMLGRRDRRILRVFPEGGEERRRIEAAMDRPSVFDSYLRYLATQGYRVPPGLLHRDVTRALEPSDELREVLRRVRRDDGYAARVGERLLNLDKGLQDWRYRHVKLVERVIGAKTGTGGSAGASYLYRTLSGLAFPDLWAVAREGPDRNTGDAAPPRPGRS
ncbi:MULTISPECIES: tryptophan 2,3-dioxygenase [Microbispora]|uniref:Tryptophan 2,3-dioxygenase n=1 Tax=Microbispora siamensis TaxID=564413 RepID=A0ABQ4GYS3_9ACTN|nr:MULTISPECIES: tryptophan 2,3-dioxygenase family protein [Microbispora]GIH66573.1 tryptophan 2,3-dioxygenase [Microbispora siamensis]